MSKADGIAKPNRSRRPTDSPGPQVKAHATTLAYDSDQVPVLIRLPDLTAATPTAAPVRQEASTSGGKERQRHTSHRAHSAVASSDQKTRTQQGFGENHGRQPRGGIWAAIPSQAMVLLILVAITALAYVLIQGKPSSGEKQETATASTAASGVPMVADHSKEPELWPANTDTSEPGPAAGESPWASASSMEQPAAPSSLAVTGSAESMDSTGDAMQESVSAVGRAGEPGPAFAGPNLNPPGDQVDLAVPTAAVAPVQGWPPELGDTDPASGSVPPATPDASWQPSGSEAPSTPSRGQSSMANSDSNGSTSDNNARSAELPAAWPAGATGASATLNGTIEFPQPRVDNERTRSGIY